MSRAENFFQRARRVIASNVDSALGAAERATGPALVQQAVRDLEAGRERLARAKAKAAERAENSREEAKRHRGAAAALGDDARFALEKDRDDLARQALADQVEREEGARAADEAAHAADIDASDLAAAIAELDAEIERARADVAAITRGGTAAKRDTRAKTAHAEELVERSRALIDRMGEGTGSRSDIAEMRRDSDIDARLAALKAAPTADPSR